jgi:hypothetical protein
MSSTTSEMSLKVEALRHFTTRSFKPCAIYDTMLNKASIRVIIEVIFTTVRQFFYNIIRSNTLNLRHKAPASLIPTTPSP